MQLNWTGTVVHHSFNCEICTQLPAIASRRLFISSRFQREHVVYGRASVIFAVEHDETLGVLAQRICETIGQ
jgi:hypothetical protein